MNLLIILLVFAAVTWLYSLLLDKAILPRLLVERTFSKSSIFAGERGTLTETVTNPSLLPIVWLRLESLVPNALQFSEQTDLGLNGDRHIQSLFTLLPRQRIIRRYPVTFRRRGAYSVNSSAITAGDVSGLCQVMQEKEARAQILVWPKLLSEREIPALLLGTIGEWRLYHPLSEDPFLIRGMRDYMPGDPVSSIHWPSSARTGRTQVKLYDPSSSALLLIILNGQKHLNQWGDLMDYEQAEIEHAISLAATLCVHALRQGCSAGFTTNLKSTDDSGNTFILPRAGRAQEELLLDTFARLQIVLGLRFETYLSGLELPSNTDILILTFYETEGMKQEIRRLRQHGCRVQLHLMSA